MNPPVKEPAAVRRRRIAELVSQGDFMRPADIAAQMSVSSETVRRDLLALEKSGELKRIHGGAMAPTRVADTEPSRVDRSTEHRREKEEIAAVVADLVCDNATVFFDVGTTVETAAKALNNSYHGVVITNSLIVGSILGGRAAVEIYVLGGRLRPLELTTFGPDVVTQAMSFNADWTFLGAGGIDVDAGLTDFATEDVPTKQAMAAKASRTYVLAVGTKLGQVAIRKVLDLDSITGVITDSGASEENIRALRNAGLDVLVGKSTSTLKVARS